MAIINTTCAEIERAVGFVYGILPVILNHTHTDCEQSWYTEDRHLLADPANPLKLMDPVISVSSDRLVSSHCVNLSHEIICHSSGFTYETLFRVRNGTDSSGGPTPESHQWWFALFFIIIIFIILCFVLRKRIFRCYLKKQRRATSSAMTQKTVEMLSMVRDP